MGGGGAFCYGAHDGRLFLIHSFVLCVHMKRSRSPSVKPVDPVIPRMTEGEPTIAIGPAEQRDTWTTFPDETKPASKEEGSDDSGEEEVAIEPAGKKRKVEGPTNVYVVHYTKYLDEDHNGAPWSSNTCTAFKTLASAEAYVGQSKLTYVTDFLKDECTGADDYATYFAEDGESLDYNTIASNFNDLVEEAIDGVYVSVKVTWEIKETELRD